MIDPQCFTKLRLYIDVLKKEIVQTSKQSPRDRKNWESCCKNLLEGIEHYRQ